MEGTGLDLHRLLDVLASLLVALITSTGAWAFFSKRAERNGKMLDLLIGLAHDRIVWLAMKYIQRGCITQDEYEDLYVYLYKPYLALGGNGTAARVMREVDALEIVLKAPGVNHNTQPLCTEQKEKM